MKVALLQSHLFWEDETANLQHISQAIEGKISDVDILILPEMFTTGFSMNVKKYAKSMQNTAFSWMKELAQKNELMILGSLMVRENGNYFNRLLALFPDGNFEFYDKKHLFSLGKENRDFTAGKQDLILEYKGWRIKPLICYDLRFPVWSRNKIENPYDCLIYVANWPQKRASAWSSLLVARAIENQAYVLGVNRVGLDGNQIPHSGDSAIIDPLGEVLAKASDQEALITESLSKEKLQLIRRQLPFLKDADDFEIL